MSFLTEFAKPHVEKLINGAIAELRYVFCFSCIANKFKEKKDPLEAVRKTVEQRAKVAAGRDNDIPPDVQFWEGEVDKLIQEDITKKQTCPLPFFGFCPDCIWRYKRGKDLAKKTEEMERLTSQGRELQFYEIPRPLPGVERFSSKYYISLESRVSKYNELLDALKDDNNYVIGLLGMGGIGKTTLAKEVGKELKQSEQFSHVIDTTVSATPDIKKIQDDIAGPLRLKLNDDNDSDRPKKLRSRLTNNDEKILLILDDVWEQDPLLDFDAIGIPKQGNHSGCRVLITTRSKQLLHKMDCDKIIELELLSEKESWTMFEMYVGKSDISSNKLSSKGREIAKECKGLPVAIAVIASSLKGRKHLKRELDATLKSLKKPVSRDGVDEDMAAIYKCLKFSYDYLKNEKAKGLFLLSSVFPEDAVIPIEILTRLGIGSGLFGEYYGSYDDARTHVVTAKKKLIDSCLWLEVDEGCIKLHDLIRDAARLIANNEIQSVNLSNKDQKSSDQRETNIKHLICVGKNTDLFSYKYDGSKLETLIVKVDTDEDCKCTEVPNSFFQNIVELRILFFLANDAQRLSLPHSIQSLVNIRSMLFNEVDLGDISVLGNLQSLETLDLFLCTIIELPHEITKLGKFKLLNLTYCEIRKNNPFKVIEGCLRLEELSFINSFNDFCLEITLPPKLKRYDIHKQWSVTMNYTVSKSVYFNADDDAYFFSKETFKYCMQTTEVLGLNGIKEGWRNLMPEIVPIDPGMNDLVELDLSYIPQLQRLIDTTGAQVPPEVLSNLVVLKLHSMENLEELFNGFLSFDSLKNLEKLSIKYCESFRSFFNCKLNLCNLKTVTLRSCPMLVSLFPLLTSRNLVLLEKLKIGDCQGLKNIITDERGEEESIEETNESDNDNKSHVSVFPKLKFLYIEECHQLESILPNLSSQDLPVLEAITIRRCEELKYIFGQYQHVELGSLKQIEMCKLPNFKGMFPKHSHSITSLLSEPSSTSRDDLKAQKQLDPIKCNMFSWSCICCHGRHKHGSMPTTSIPPEDQRQDNTVTVSNWPLLQIWERAECLPVQPHIMCNIKEITLFDILKIKSVFILSIAPRMLVETLRIGKCRDLKHLIVDTDDHESGGNNWDRLFPKLKSLYVEDCMQLEYIFGHYTGDHQNHTEIHLHLPALQSLNLCNLPCLVDMCPKQYCTTFPSLKELEIDKCSQVAVRSVGEFFTHPVSESPNSLNMKASNSHHLQIWERAQCLPIQPHTMCNIKEITLSHILKIKSMFILSIAPRMLVETLTIRNCDELKHLIVDIGDHESGSNNWGNVFPKLKSLDVKDCMQLEYIFGHYKIEDHQNHTEIHLHLPALQRLDLCNLPCLVDMCPKQYCTTFPSLKQLRLIKCSQFDIKSLGEFIIHPVSESPDSIKVSNSQYLQICEPAQCLLVQPHIMCNIKEIELSHITKIKSMFIPSIASRMLVETLKIEVCHELKHLIVDIGDHESGGNNWGNVFPKLKNLKVEDCKQLEYIFGHYTEDPQNHVPEIHLHLPALEGLNLCNLPSLVAMSPKQYRTTFPPLKQLRLIKCSQVAIKSIGEFIIHPVSEFLDSINTKESSGSVEHFSALQIFVLDDSKAENIFYLNKIDGTQMNLGLRRMNLYDLPNMRFLFVGPKNSFALKNLTIIRIVRCEILEIVFSTSILRCLSQLVYLTIEECKELKYIIEDDNDMQNQNLSNSSGTYFPKLTSLVVVKCHKLKSVFPVSICKELPQLEALMIREADELEEIFKINEGHQNLSTTCFPKLRTLVVEKCHKLKCIFSVSICKELLELKVLMIREANELEEIFKINEYHLKVETPKLNIVVFVKLPSLFHTQGIQFQAAKYRFVQNCQNLSNLTSASTPNVYDDLRNLYGLVDDETKEVLVNLFEQLQEESKSRNPGNAETTEDELAVGIEVEASLGHKLISSQIQTKQTPEEAEHAIVENDPDLEISSEPLVNEQSTSRKCLTNQNHPHGEIDSTVKPSHQGNDCLNEIEDQHIQEGYTPVKTVATTMPKQKCAEEGTTLTNSKSMTPSTHLQLVSSLQEQDFDVRETTDTAKTKDDQVSPNDNAHMKQSSIIEEQFPKDDEFRVSKSKPSPSNSIPLPLAFQTSSLPSEVSPSQIMEDFSFPSLVTWELEQLVSNKHLDYENLSLLTDFLVKHPSLLLRGTSLRNRYKGYAYNSLADLLKFLQIHSVLDVSGSHRLEFVELLQDVRKCAFDKNWLDGIEKRALFPDSQFSQDALQNLLDSNKQVTKDVEVMRLNIDVLSQHAEDLKHQLTSTEAILESIIQNKAALSAPLGY